MSISYKAPHLPFTPDTYFDYVYKGEKYKKPENYGAKNAEHLSAQSKSGRQYSGYEFWRDSEENYQTAIKKYNQLIHGVDYSLGMIRKSLEELGVADNTIIIFTSDNGYSCGAHNFGGKVLPYEEASKSPFIIFDPRAKKQSIKISAVTANIDIAPTILEYAGVKIPKNMDGLSVVKIIAKPTKFKNRNVMLTNMWGSDETQEMAVVNKDWKYIYWQYQDHRMKPTEELFYVGKDRLEMTNHATDSQYKQQLKKMRKVYDKQYRQLAKNVITYNNYQKYITLFNREANVHQKQPLYTDDYGKDQRKKELEKKH
ncbi:arylsulfatase A-like enzyme [Wenyingzhuangia heitensis]|uniref:Arylsulfatase A-like enzyme n=1 Tax=Wenyingzhuangia heitensis TaxID=1487859 RepID=A0ABX0UC78_9FLAO|nr:sulfatase-like hydrolase/transferase [Wenyingzhuangia heitensis]NIJ45933.1 arylsulfatase A-like enzyme [Wenyingzhuangia heitensis]